jgi:ankyrin repeat protein
MDNSDKLFQAIMKGDGMAVAGLLQQQAELANARTPSGVQAVLFCLYYGQPRVAALFLDYGCQPDVFSCAALGLAGHLQSLLEQDAAVANAVAADGFSPLGLASFFGQPEAAQLLIERGARVNQASHNPQKVMPLHSAAAGQHLEVAKLLLEAGAEVDAVQEGGFTPLMSAAQNGQVEMMSLLLDHGADRTKQTPDGRSAYSFADGHINPAVAALFFKR